MSLDQKVLFWNQSAQRILGYAPDEVIGRQLNETIEWTVVGGPDPASRDGILSILSLSEGRMPARVQVPVRCASGDLKLVWLTPMVIAGATSDSPILVHLFQEDVGSEEDAHEDLEADDGAELTGEPSEDDRAPDAGPGLTAREMEVLRLVALGWATPRIAEELSISPHTVLNHIRHFRRKLNAPTKLDAVVTAIRLGILPVQ